MSLGRNQLIGLSIGGAGFLSTLLFVVLGKIDGPAWLGWITAYIGVWMGLILGPSAVVKGAQALKGPPPPSQGPSL